MIFNNETDRPGSFNTATDDDQSTNMVRLIEDSTIEKTIRFDEMSVPDTPDPKNMLGGNTKTDELGLVYPMIRINDIVLARQNITSMTLSMSGFCPTISLSLVFEDTSFLSKNMPKDGDMISIYIRTDTAALTYLRDDFIITSCNGSNRKEGAMGNRISINGRLYVNGFDSKNTTHAITGSSKYAMKEIAKTYGIGFAYNDFDDTDDIMTWIQCREPTESYVNHIVSHAWKNETSFFKAWIDLYYNLCFVNVNKFLLSTENEEEIDITFATNILNMYNEIKGDSSIGEAKMSMKILTNMQDFKQTPFFITKWDPVNNSSAVSLTMGYSTTTFSYLHNQNIINEGDYDCFEILENIPAYDQNKTDSYILLRGRATYDPEQNPETEQARVNYDYTGLYNRTVWTGVEYVMSDDDKDKDSNMWSGNVHKNYNRAPYHNAQNLGELNKMYLKVTCDGLNLQIMKGERIPVLLCFNNSIENEMYNSATETDLPRESNRFYSGYYIVDSVEYKYVGQSKGKPSPYKTSFILKRREWPTPEIIQKDETQQ